MSSPKCTMEGEFKSLIQVWLKVLASLCYCYFIASKIPKGKLRLLSLSPIFYLFTILPLQLSSVLPTGITASFITWLTNFKLLLFSFDLGPLSSYPPKSLPIFLLTASFPMKIKHNHTYPSNQNLQKPIKVYSKEFSFHKSLLSLPAKAFLFAVLLLGLNDQKQNLHPRALLGLYCCLLYLLIDVVLGLCNSFVNAVLGMELELPSNEPYLSTSLQDFWGRRWNLMVTNALRHTVYKPVRSLLQPVLGPQWAPLPAVFAAFLVSGLMHELIFYYVTRAAPTWEVTWFFVLHGGCLVMELGVKKLLGPKRRLHWALSGPMTVAFVVASAAWLFFPPLLRSGADEKAIKEFKNFVDCIMEKVGKFIYNN